MEDLAEILEQELERAVEVRDKESLRRYIKLLTQNVVSRGSYELQLMEVKNEIRLVVETMREGFKSIDKRFEAIDKRFEAIDKRFEAINKRFEAIDKRFEDMQKYMDKRFEAVDKRFEDMNRHFNRMFTVINIGIGLILLLTVLFKFMQ